MKVAARTMAFIVGASEGAQEVREDLSARGELLVDQLAQLGGQRKAGVPVRQARSRPLDRLAELGELVDEFARLAR